MKGLTHTLHFTNQIAPQRTSYLFHFWKSKFQLTIKFFLDQMFWICTLYFWSWYLLMKNVFYSLVVKWHYVISSTPNLPFLTNIMPSIFIAMLSTINPWVSLKSSKDLGIPISNICLDENEWVDYSWWKSILTYKNSTLWKFWFCASTLYQGINFIQYMLPLSSTLW